MSNKKSELFDKVPLLQKLKSIKHIEFIVLGIFVLILAVIFLSNTNTEQKQNITTSSTSLEEYGEYLEGRLEGVIKNINGAGDTRVMVTFDGRITYEYATEKEEVTTSSSVTGGTNSKNTVNEEVIIITQNGKQTPLVVKEIYPSIAGVVIVSSGAGNVSVKLNIISAVQTLLGVDSSKIQVLVGK